MAKENFIALNLIGETWKSLLQREQGLHGDINQRIDSAGEMTAGRKFTADGIKSRQYGITSVAEIPHCCLADRNKAL